MNGSDQHECHLFGANAGLSFVQNGAERKREVHVEWKTLDVRALSHGAECALRKAPDCRDWNLSPFLLLSL